MFTFIMCISTEPAILGLTSAEGWWKWQRGVVFAICFSCPAHVRELMYTYICTHTRTTQREKWYLCLFKSERIVSAVSVSDLWASLWSEMTGSLSRNGAGFNYWKQHINRKPNPVDCSMVLSRISTSSNWLNPAPQTSVWRGGKQFEIPHAFMCVCSPHSQIKTKLPENKKYFSSIFIVLKGSIQTQTRCWGKLDPSSLNLGWRRRSAPILDLLL